MTERAGETTPALFCVKPGQQIPLALLNLVPIFGIGRARVVNPWLVTDQVAVSLSGSTSYANIVGD